MLDITILDENERPMMSRGVGFREHQGLMAAAKQANARYLSRLHDYYSDAAIEVDELPEFRKELKLLLTEPKLSRELIDLIDVLDSLAERALRERRRIVAIAD